MKYRFPILYMLLLHLPVRIVVHVLVKESEGSFDFVFSDADKGWYKNYFIDIDPKLKTGGYFTSHNISL